MTSRGRGGSNSDWDPMRDEFNDTSYKAQYPDDNTSEGVQLDHTKLYITRLPTALSQEGFVDLFSKYGRVVSSFFNKDPSKKFAFVTFETAGEARIAMMKLNKTEPFNMNICFAHNKNQARMQQSQPNMDRSHFNTDRSMNRHSNTDRHSHNTSARDDVSISSQSRKARNVEEHANGIEDQDTEESDLEQDPKLGYDLEKIKLQRLQIMDQQLVVHQRMMLHQQRMKNNTLRVTKRRLLPDGRIEVRDETSFTAGGGDSRNIPGLQREPTRQCVVCGKSAGLYCAACRITPYCGERCQRRDWETRHRAVCHNLARLNAEEEDKRSIDVALDVAPVAPLRRPHSPSKKPHNDSGSEKGTKARQERQNRNQVTNNAQLGRHFQPEGQNRNQVTNNAQLGIHFQPEGQNRNQVTNNAQLGRQFQPEGQNRNHVTNNAQPVSRSQPEEKNRNQVTNNAQPGNRSQPEDKNRKHVTNNAQPGIQFQPEGQNRNQVSNNKVTPNRYQNGKNGQGTSLRRPMQQPKQLEPEETKQKSETTTASIGSLGDVTPRKPLVPASFVVEKLKNGATFLAEVTSLAVDCGSKQAGYVCLTLQEDYGAAYDSLCDAFKAECDKDSEEYTPRIGETFAYCSEDDGFWYRARCLARTRAALLDAGRVVSFTPRSSRRLPAAFATIPEFMAVFKAKDLPIGGSLTCKVVSAGRVSLTDESGKTVEADATRWLPELEYPTEPKVAVPQVPKEPEPTHEIAAIKPLVPTSFVVEKLEEGTPFLAEVIALAGDCGSKQAGYICLTLHQDYSELYDSLCEEFKALCDKDSEHYTPGIGETFAYFSEDDGYWYRARCLARTRAALLDAGRVVSFTPRSSRRLPASFATIPEFMAVVKAKKLTIGDHLSCKMLSKSDVIRVTLEQAPGETVTADAMRWLPDIEYPTEPIAVSVTPNAPVSLPIVPEVPRPEIEHNIEYILLDVTSLRRACVRPSDPRLAAMFDSVLQDTLLYGLTASPLKEPPQKGQTVVAKFLEDGNHYRAFVKRTNANLNKYLIEYIEYGNEEIVTLDRLYPCPAKLQIDACPTQASLIKLSDREPAALTPAARKYIDNLKENAVQLTLLIPGGAKTASSGSLASLIVTKGCEPASKKIEDLCTPEWKKVAERGGDVLELESCFYPELEYVTLPTSRPFTLSVTFYDLTTLEAGALSGHEKGDKAAEYVFTELSKQIEEYCESSLCREPYLPKIEELCVSKHDRSNKWVRSVVVQLSAGAERAHLLDVDSGELRHAAVRALRRLPRALAAPRAAAPHCDLRDFPAQVSRAQLERGLRLLGAGELRVRTARRTDDNMYELDAPELIAALTE